MARTIQVAATSQTIYVFIQDSTSTTGAGLAGLAYNTASLTAYYVINGSASVAITLATLASASAAWATGGFKEVDATNCKGLYRLDLPNAALASGASVVVYLQGAASMVPVAEEIQLVAYNPQVASLQANVIQWNSANVASPATAGIPDVNVKNINNVATTSVTTINAVIGTAVALQIDGSGYVKVSNGTGTGQLSITSGVVSSNAVQINAVSTSSVTTISAFIGSTVAFTFDANNYVKTDLVDIAGVAVSATTAQLGTNVVNWNNTVVATPATAGIPDINVKNIAGTASAGTAGYVGLDWGHITAKTTVNDLTNTTILGIDSGGSGGNVNVTQWGGSNIVTPNVSGVPIVDLKYTLGTLSAGTAGYMGIDWSAINAKTSTAILSGTTISTTQVVASVAGNVGGNVVGSVGSVSGNVGGNVVGSVGSVLNLIIRTGTAQAGAAATITLDAGASATNNLYQNEIIYIQSGTGAGQINSIASYVGSTKVATVANNWITNPASDSVFYILSTGIASATTAGGIASAVWNALAASYDTVNTMGALLNAAGAGADPATIAAAVWAELLPGAFTSGEAGYILGTLIQTLLSQLGRSVVMNSQPGSAGTFTVQQGYAYNSTLLNALVFNVTGFPDLTSATITLIDHATGNTLGTAVVTTGGAPPTVQVITVSFTAAQTLALPVGQGTYSLKAVLSSVPLLLSVGPYLVTSQY